MTPIEAMEFLKEKMKFTRFKRGVPDLDERIKRKSG